MSQANLVSLSGLLLRIPSSWFGIVEAESCWAPGYRAFAPAQAVALAAVRADLREPPLCGRLSGLPERILDS
jgi:hypothetical protein